ncbi:dipeptidyl peptidase 2 [Amphiprion ocellaris]|uniref:Dipeptidyl peptidase 2 n=1 Tax=Amphiprion ocellaris TaxID=80972 RepID=A0A3Q1CJ84_AMPOC|nr:dipeptidyl peptidase 2 [Amphiprion ocellaris]
MRTILAFFTVTVTLFCADVLHSLPYSHFQSRKHNGVKADPQFTEKYFSQTVDHFNFNSMGNGSFNQRYLITDKYWKKGYGPIFFYTGNEGDIWEFALNSGFITELAAQQGALVIFAEHRYYGTSLPFGNDSFNIPQIGLLTVEQALADYAIMITELKLQLGATDSPVIVFGGSYGGMLSVYMRLKYPNIVAGALAASAPILSTAGLGDSRQFFRDVTADFANVASECRDAVRQAFHQLKDLAEQQDYSRIQSEFALCKPPSSAQDIHQLNGLLRNGFTLMAMLDYPYSTHFMGNMPANPVQVACKTMLGGSNLLANLRDTAGIVYNSTGLLTCFDLYSLYVECADPTGCGLGFNSQAWDYQACTEIELCYESNNVTDMFPPMPFTEREREVYCSKRWAVVPRPGWLKIQFWADALSTASNIIFSNGDLDPWANGGVRKALSSSLVAINISEGAHHLDLRASNEADPVSVIKARKREAELITQWVEMERRRSQKFS